LKVQCNLPQVPDQLPCGRPPPPTRASRLELGRLEPFIPASLPGAFLLTRARHRQDPYSLMFL
jgi:hypothetical protein